MLAEIDSNSDVVGDQHRRIPIENRQPNDSNKLFEVSFDKQLPQNESRPYHPTLSLILVPRSSATLKIPHQSALDSCSENPDDIFGKILPNEWNFVSYFSILLLVTSSLLMLLSIWIEAFMQKDFKKLVLMLGTFDTFPLHYALIINSAFGFISATTIAYSCFRRRYEPCIVQVIGVLTVFTVWSFITVLYSFGASILYQSELEMMMVRELDEEVSEYWVNSQNFYHCCGIASYGSWDHLNKETNDKGKTYPKSCCDSKLAPCKGNPVESEVYKSGCLGLETEMLLEITYFTIFVVVLHFWLQVFSVASLVKLFFRQRFVVKKSEDLSRDLATSPGVAEEDADAKQNEIYKSASSVSVNYGIKKSSSW